MIVLLVLLLLGVAAHLAATGAVSDRYCWCYYCCCYSRCFLCTKSSPTVVVGGDGAAANLAVTGAAGAAVGTAAVPVAIVVVTHVVFFVIAICANAGVLLLLFHLPVGAIHNNKCFSYPSFFFFHFIYLFIFYS